MYFLFKTIISSITVWDANIRPYILQQTPQKYKLKTTTKKKKTTPKQNKGGTLVIYERHKLISKSDINSFYNL